MLLNCGVGEDSLDSKEIQPVHPKGNQSWIFIARTNAEAETPILWPPDGKNWLIGKDPDAGKDWRQKETGMIEDEMVGWHPRLNGHEFESTLGIGDGQGSLCVMGLQRVGHDWATDLIWSAHHLSQKLLQFTCAKLLQLCLTPCSVMDCNLSSSSVHGIFQARILE